MEAPGKAGVAALAAAWAAEVGFREVAEAMARAEKKVVEEEAIWEMETEAAAAKGYRELPRVAMKAPVASEKAAVAEG